LDKTPDTAGTDRLDKPAFADCLGDLTGRPMTTGPSGIRRIFTRDRDHLDNLCRRKSGQRARARVIGQRLHDHRRERFSRAPIGCNLLQLGGQSQPSLAPYVYRPAIEAHLARHVALVGSRLQR